MVFPRAYIWASEGITSLPFCPFSQSPNTSPINWSLVQFSSVAQLCSTLCDPMDCSKPGLPGLLQWHPTPVLLPGKSHGWRNLMGCSPWGREKSDTTERLHFDFSLSCIGEGNGNPLQCSCLENPRDRGAWWAAVYGVAQSWTQLKRLSSSTRVGGKCSNSSQRI